MNQTEMKRCRKCGELIPLSEFPPDKKSSDGKFSYCRPCKLEYQRKHRQKEGKKPRAQRSGITLEEMRKQMKTESPGTKYPSDTWTRHTFIVKRDDLNTLKALRRFTGKDITVMLSEALGAYFARWP